MPDGHRPRRVRGRRRDRPALTPVLGRRVFHVAALAPAAAAVLTVAQTAPALHGGVTERFGWIRSST
ncbi:hypothetical protein P9139_05090 [Curtobacterium flaccumfaciens]|nr:hypothetical protein P9139_05090 [Curtobacterium flaccumfaciens]